MDRRSTLSPTLGQEAETLPLALALKPSLGATWAVLCGCLSSGAVKWDGFTALRVLAVWLVADATLGCVLAQLMALKRATWGATAAGTRQRGAASFIVPYAAPGSPGARLAAWVNDYLAQWRQVIWKSAGRAGLTALVSTGLALIVATFLGREVLGVVSGGLLLAACLAALAGRDEVRLGRWLAGLQIALAWSLGHLVLAPWRASALGLALLVGLGAYARSTVETQPGRLGLGLLEAVWAVLVLVLLMARQPVPAGLVAIAALAERMTLGSRREERRRGLPIGQLAWMLALLLVALATTYWG